MEDAAKREEKLRGLAMGLKMKRSSGWLHNGECLELSLRGFLGHSMTSFSMKAANF